MLSFFNIPFVKGPVCDGQSILSAPLACVNKNGPCLLTRKKIGQIYFDLHRGPKCFGVRGGSLRVILFHRSYYLNMNPQYGKMVPNSKVAEWYRVAELTSS